MSPGEHQRSLRGYCRGVRSALRWRRLVGAQRGAGRVLAAFMLFAIYVCAFVWPVDAGASRPDGQIAFVRSGAVWVMDADGQGQRQLTEGSSDRHPSWSPDGQSLAFVRALEGTPGEVRIVDVDSGAERRLPFELDLARMPGTDRPDVVYEILAVAWAPDGAHLAVAGGAFSSYPDMASGLNEVQVFVVRPDGTGLRRVGPRVGGATERLSWRPDSDAVLLTQYYRMA